MTEIKMPVSETSAPRGDLVRVVGPIKSYAETFKPHVVKLSEKGRKFSPRYGAVGSTIYFEHDGQRLAGEVWSLGPRKGTRWVVRDQVAYLVVGGS